MFCFSSVSSVPASRVLRPVGVKEKTQRCKHYKPTFAKSAEVASSVQKSPDDETRTDAASHKQESGTYVVEEHARHVFTDEATSPTASVSGAFDEPSTSGAGKTNYKLIGSVLSVAGLLLLIGTGVYYADSIREFLVFFATVVDDWGPLGVLAYFGLYTALEVLAVPAIPLTMTAGAIFGIVPGTLITSLAGTLAATISFLIARYVARDRFKAWATKNRQFRAIDKVIGENGFKVVTLLRLSPLFPLAASNYLYGLTSVPLSAYFLGSWVGMIPGTLAYVSAGHVSKVAIVNGGELPLQWWQIALALGVSALAIGYIGTLAKKALAEMDEEVAAEGPGDSSEF